MWPDIGIIIPTYNRLRILTEVVSALQDHAMYPGRKTFYIGVDNDRESADQVARYVYSRTSINIIAVDGPRRQHKKKAGLGSNLNLLLNISKEEIVMQMDDDHLLLKPLDLMPHVEKLMQDESAGWIRLMGVASHNYCACLRGCYWIVNWDSPEVYITSNRPHIKHKRFHMHYGFYPEGLKLGETEEQFCHSCIDMARRAPGPNVLVPLNVMTESGWDHVGASWQLTGE